MVPTKKATGVSEILIELLKEKGEKMLLKMFELVKKN